jgi:hypothetical protein
MTSMSAPYTKLSRCITDTTLMFLAGSLGEHAEDLAAQVAEPGDPSIPHLAAPAAALGFAQRGDAGRALDLANRWFEPPPVAWTWMQAVSYRAQVAIILGSPDPNWLYDRLVPHSWELALVGSGEPDCGGAVDSPLAGLALQLGRTEEAMERAHSGLALERHAGARLWLPRTSALIDKCKRSATST